MATDTGAPGFIWIPDDQIRVDQLQVLFATLAGSVNTGLANTITNINKTTPVAVASAAARNALFPTPVQGNRVYRTDLGREDVYYGTYNVTTNPGGATAAGWVTKAEPFATSMGFAASVTIPANSFIDTTITFPAGRFSVPPIVQVTLTATTRGNTVWVESVTATNFVLRRGTTNGSNQAGAAYWTAQQMTPFAAAG